jgi:hypothetical protein
MALILNELYEKTTTKEVLDAIKQGPATRSNNPVLADLPTTNSVDPPHFGALKTLSAVFCFCGWLIIIVGIIVAFFLFLYTGGYNGIPLYIPFLVGIGAFFTGLLLLALGELIKLFLQIEENTRKK